MYRSRMSHSGSLKEGRDGREGRGGEAVVQKRREEQVSKVYVKIIANFVNLE